MDIDTLAKLNSRNAIVGWLEDDEAKLADNIAYMIAEQVCKYGADSVEVNLLDTFAKLEEKSEANFIEWLNK